MFYCRIEFQNITPAIKHDNCHAGLEPASSILAGFPLPDQVEDKLLGNDRIDIIICRNNNITNELKIGFV
jgi:hypothetical protein